MTVVQLICGVNDCKGIPTKVGEGTETKYKPNGAKVVRQYVIFYCPVCERDYVINHSISNSPAPGEYN